MSLRLRSTSPYTYTFSDVCAWHSSDGGNRVRALRTNRSNRQILPPSVPAAISRPYIISSGKPRLNATSNPPAAGSLALVRSNRPFEYNI